MLLQVYEYCKKNEILQPGTWQAVEIDMGKS